MTTLHVSSEGHGVTNQAIHGRVSGAIFDSRHKPWPMGYENDFCTFDKQRLSDELDRQIQGAGRDGAFVVGTPIMPPNAMPEAVDFYFSEARRLGMYGDRGATR